MRSGKTSCYNCGTAMTFLWVYGGLGRCGRCVTDYLDATGVISKVKGHVNPPAPASPPRKHWRNRRRWALSRTAVLSAMWGQRCSRPSRWGAASRFG